jgi:hypothetical protein
MSGKKYNTALSIKKIQPRITNTEETPKTQVPLLTIKKLVMKDPLLADPYLELPGT